MEEVLFLQNQVREEGLVKIGPIYFSAILVTKSKIRIKYKGKTILKLRLPQNR